MKVKKQIPSRQSSSRRSLQLDTTIQISRIFDYQYVQKFLTRLIKEHECYVSRYVLYEYKRTIIRAFITFHTYLEEENNLGDALIRASQQFSDRDSHRAFYVITKLAEQAPLDSPDIKRMIARLKRCYSEELITRFEEGIEYSEDYVNCRPAYANCSEKSCFLEQIRCVKRTSKCKSDRFFSESRKQEALRSYISLCKEHPFSENSEYKRVSEVCQKVLEDVREAKGNNCKTLGDFIITLETPKNRCVLTTNKGDFRLTCKAAGKKLLVVRKGKRADQQCSLEE